MYYYILEYSQTANFNNLQNKLRQTLTNLNISGEMAVSSPARSAEELAQIALERGYTTIVAVGGDLLVNRLVNVLATSQAALGVIPYNLSKELGDIFAGVDFNNACHALKSRKTRIIDLGKIKPNKYFLSDAVISPENPIKCAMEIDSLYTLEATICHLSINRDLQVTFYTDLPKKKSWWGASNKTAENFLTTTQANSQINLISVDPVSVTVSGHEIVKTPIQLTQAKEVLKIITNRDTIN